jgi:hypothetical protein
MYKVIKRIGNNFVGDNAKIIGEFEIFDEAHKFATDNVCQDIYHEGSKTQAYFFSDKNGDAQTPYDCLIEFNK